MKKYRSETIPKKPWEIPSSKALNSEHNSNFVTLPLNVRYTLLKSKDNFLNLKLEFCEFSINAKKSILWEMLLSYA